MGTLILDEGQVDQKIRRIAYQVYENNFGEKIIYIAGIIGAGYVLASKLKEELEKISPIKAHLIKIDLNKQAPARDEINIDFDLTTINNKVILLVDDVLNTGKTFAYGMRPFLNIKVKKIEVAVLVNRAHSSFPVAPTYTGYELSTTLDEHINVVLEEGKKGVYLH